jgi:hypothetical protein
MARTKTKLRTRTVAIIVGIGVAVAGGGIAFAYFTNVGAGSGAAGTGSNVPVVVKQTSTVAAMAPGIAAQPLVGNFDNPNAGPVFLKSVKAEVTGVTMVGTPPGPACTVTDFVIAGGTQGATTQIGTTVDVRASSTGPAGTGVGVEVPNGTAQGYWAGLTLQLINKPTNQDACKGSTVAITYTAA